MHVRIYSDRRSLGRAAADHAGRAIRHAIDATGRARIVAATGTSQFDFLEALVSQPGIEWPRVEMFHLDEYVGIALDHPASFRRYLLERFISKAGITRYYLLDAERDATRVAVAAGRELASAPVDIAFAGIGENGHLAFNDPPADFETEEPYIIVTLDDACRRQQVGEGWFAAIEEVPVQAISMSIRQILKSREIICVVPDSRKARAVKACVEGEVSPLAPASILQTHPAVTVFLDNESSALLERFPPNSR
jgi:glucosamine-6-phosphate deaminase